MKVDDRRLHLTKGASEPERACDVSTPSAPADCADVDAELPEHIADRPVAAKKYHGQPVLMGIQGVVKILHRARYPARMLLAGAKHMNDVDAMAQARVATMLRTFSSTLFP